MAIRSTDGLVKEAQKSNKKLKGATALDMVKPRAYIIEQTKEQLKEHGLPNIGETIDRTNTNTFRTGGVLTSLDENAKGKVKKLTNEFLGPL